MSKIQTKMNKKIIINLIVFFRKYTKHNKKVKKNKQSNQCFTGSPTELTHQHFTIKKRINLKFNCFW